MARNDDLYKALGDEGYTGTLNDRMVKAMRTAQSDTSSGYNTLLANALETQYAGGSFSVNFRQWKDNMFTIVPILGGGGVVTGSFDLSNINATADSSYLYSGTTTTADDIYLSSSGDKLFLAGSSTVWYWTLTTPWDLSTASSGATFNVGGQETGTVGLCFSDDGTEMYVSGTAGDGIDQYTLSTAWDLTTATATGFSGSLSAQGTSPQAISINNDGTKMFVLQTGDGGVDEYALSTAYDITSIGFTGTYATGISSPVGFTFARDGSKFYVGRAAGSDIKQFNCSTAFDISTASDPLISFTGQSRNDGIYVSPDGTYFVYHSLGTNTAYSHVE